MAENFQLKNASGKISKSQKIKGNLKDKKIARNYELKKM